MPIDELEEKLAERTWKERVADRRKLIPLDLTTQYRGNRIISHFYPEHWALVQLARQQAERYGRAE
jgi:hypothetical protein